MIGRNTLLGECIGVDVLWITQKSGGAIKSSKKFILVIVMHEYAVLELLAFMKIYTVLITFPIDFILTIQKFEIMKKVNNVKYI